MLQQNSWRNEAGVRELQMTDGYLAHCCVPNEHDIVYRLSISRKGRQVVLADLLNDGRVRVQGNLEVLSDYSVQMTSANGLSADDLGRLDSISDAVFSGNISSI